MKNFVLIVFSSIFLINIAYAQGNDDRIAIFAENCSKISKDEPKAKSRLRAQDQALFSSIASLSVLELPKKEFDQYDYNKLIYNLSDNYVNDLRTKTISQDDKKICVNVSGYILGKDIISSIIEAKTYSDARKIQNQKDDLGENKYSIPEDIFNEISRDIERIEQNININDIDISEEVELENPVNSEQIKNFVVDEIKYEDDMPSLMKERESFEKAVSKPLSSFETSLKKQNLKSFIYIAPTKFYNNTESNQHSKVIEDELKNNVYLYVTSDKKAADYIIYPNVLRVKVDAINEETNRLQMVTMVEIEDLSDNSKVKEYQNRFTLFTNDDNEQEIAKDLMEKLIIKATSQIMPKIEAKERKKQKINTLPSIITPGNSTL